MPFWIVLAPLGMYVFIAARDLGCNAFLLGINLDMLCLFSASAPGRAG